MISDVSAPVRLVERDASPLQNISGGKHVFHMRVPAKRDDMRMLDKQELVRNLAPLALFHQPALQPERLGIAEAPKIPDLASTH
jgi:hypothetical protein